MKLGMQVGLSTGNIVLDGELGTHLPPQRGTAPQFTAYLHCGQTAGWIKMPLGVEVGLGPSDFMLDGDSAPKKGGHSPPNFWPMSSVAKRLDASTCHLVWR